MITARELIALYLRHCEAENVHGEQARRDRQTVLNDFASVHGDKPVAELKAFHLKDWIESHQSWKKSSTRRERANNVRAAFQWAADDERIDRNPFKRVRYAEGERRPEFADDVLEQFIAAADPCFAICLRFLRFTGCRISELCNCIWEDLDLVAGIWLLGKHKTRRWTKKPKTIPLVDEAVELLKSIRDRFIASRGLSPTGPVFLNTQGTPWNRGAFDSYFSRLKERVLPNYEPSIHGIRHRLAGQAIKNGASTKLVGGQLGHKSVRTTEKYYLDMDDQTDAIRDAARLGLPKPPPADPPK